LASALGHQASAQGKKVLYYFIQKLLILIKIARLGDSFLKLFNKIAKSNLLIIDDFGLSRLEDNGQMNLMEIIEN